MEVLVEFGLHWRPLVQLELVTLVKFNELLVTSVPDNSIWQ